MNPLARLLSALSVLLLAACVGGGDAPIQATQFFRTANECGPSAEAPFTSGGLNLGGSGTYLATWQVRNFLSPADNTSVGSKNLVTGEQRNLVLLDQVAHSYTSVPALPFEREVTNILASVPAGGNTDLTFSLFGPKALQRLRDSVNTGDSVDVRVTVEFRGYIASGGRVASAPVSFPVQVYRTTTPNCGPAGFITNGPCGTIGGQDNNPICCARDADGGTATPSAACAALAGGQ